MDIILNALDGKSFNTFKFQYSKYNPFQEFIPKNKKQIEFIIGMYYSQFRVLHYNKIVEYIELCEDDSNKKSDIVIKENDEIKSIQITRLTFTKYEERKAIAKKRSLAFAEAITKDLQIDFKLNVNIFSKSKKDQIPLKDLKNKRNKIEKRLIEFIVKSINNHKNKLSVENKPIPIQIQDSTLSKYYSFLNLNPIPKESYSRFHGLNNVFINYDFDDVSFDKEDVEKSINELYNKKNEGSSDILLIWANVFELVSLKEYIADQLRNKFMNSTFKEVFLMTFYDNEVMFRDTLELRPLKILKGNEPVKG